MDTTMNNLHPDTASPVDETPQAAAASRPARGLRRSGDDVVRWAEFQLALWMGGIALTVMLGGFGFLYTAITDLRTELRTEMQAQRTEMQAEHAEIRSEIGDLRNEVIDLRNEVINVRERVVRIETRLDTASGPAAEDA